MDERTFETLADRELTSLLAALTRALDEGESLDFEADLQMGILNIEFSDGTKYVINSHRAAKQIWMAAERNAWHFDPKTEGTDTHWRAEKSGDELWPTVERVVSRKSGQSVHLSVR